jgi:hypothetical protein
MLDPYIRATLQHDSKVGVVCNPVLASSALCSTTADAGADIVPWNRN